MYFISKVITITIKQQKDSFKLLLKEHFPFFVSGMRLYKYFDDNYYTAKIQYHFSRKTVIFETVSCFVRLIWKHIYIIVKIKQQKYFVKFTADVLLWLFTNIWMIYYNWLKFNSIF